MILLSIIMVAVATAPARIIRTNRTKRLRVKICVCIASALTGFGFIAMVVAVDDLSVSNDNLTEVGAKMLTVLRNEIVCMKATKNGTQLGECLQTFEYQVNVLNEMYPDLDIMNKGQ